MPLTPRQTNVGIPLHSRFLGGESDTVREIPPEFRAAVDLHVLEQPIPYDVLPEIVPLSDTILANKIEQKFTSESTLRTTSKPPGIVTLNEVYTSPHKQISQRTRNFRPITDLPIIAVPSPTRDVNTKNLGNYHFIEDVEDVGTLFVDQLFEETIPEVIPEEFRVLLPTLVDEHLEVGIATLPPLAAGDLSHSEKQENVFVKRVRRGYRDLLGLPKSLESFKLTPEQQVMDVVGTLDNGLQTLSPTALMLEGDVKNLGNATSLRTTGTVPEVFSKQLFSVERQIFFQLPAEFRAAVPETTTSDEEAGVATLPVLSGGDILRTEQQTTEFKKKVENKFRDLSALPLTFVDYKLTPEGQVETLSKTLSTSPTGVVGDAVTLEEMDQNLGAGLFLFTEGTVPNVFPKQLYSRERQILGAIPAEFRVGIETVTTSDEEAGLAVDPGPLTGTVEFISEQQVTEFRRKVEQRALDLSATGTHTDYKMTPEQQLETLNIVLTNIAPTPSVFTATTLEEEIKTLGGGLWLSTSGTVPDVFSKATFSRERQLLGAIPAEFRVGLQTITTSDEEAGIAADPGVLTGGVEFASQRQVTEFKRMVEQRSLDLSALATFTDYRMTPEQQLETISRQVTNVSPTPSAFSATTVEEEIKTLGGGLWLVTGGSVPDVFTQVEYAIEIPDPVPLEYRVLSPVLSTSIVSAGVAVPPTLATGDLSKSEKQTTEFKVRTDTKHRDLTALPASLTSYKLTPEGQIETVIGTLAVGLQTIIGGATTLEAESKNLGNATSLKTVGTVPDVFSKQLFARERTILGAIPAEFRVGIQTITTSDEEAGIAVDPGVLTGGVETASQQQVTEFKRKVEQRTLDLSALATFTDYKMTPEQQLETISRQVTNISPTPSAITATTVEEEIKTLGGGLWLVTGGTVPDVFSKATFTKEIPDAVPREFGVLIPVSEQVSESAGIAADPTLGTGELRHESRQVTEFRKQETTRFRSLIGLPKTLSEYKLTPEQQIGTLVKVFDVGLQTLSPSATTVEGAVINLGNSTSVRSQTDTPDVFPKHTYAKEIPDAVPREFAVLIPISEQSFESAGIAADPTLGTGELRHESKQVTEFKKQDVTRFRSLTSLPATLNEYRLTPEQQIATVVKTLATGLLTLSPSATTVEGNVINLGNGTSVESQADVPSVFSKQLFSKEVQLLGALPAEFRVGIQQVTTSDEQAGTAAVPTLGPGVEFASEQQITQFKKKVEQRSLDFSGLGTLLGEEITEEFGGGVLGVNRIVDSSPLTVAGGFLTTSGRSQAIGGGLYFRETKTLEGTAWSLLQGQQYDERLDVVLPFTQQVVPAGTGVGVAKTDIEPIDVWRQRNRTIDTSVIGPVLSAYLLSYPSKINVELPDILVGVTGIVQSALGEGAGSEDGSYSATGSFSVSQALRATAQSSANLAVDAQIDIKQFWGNNINSTHYHFFLPSPVTAADVLAKINALLAPATVSAWPKYNPQIVNLVSVSKRASLQVVATSQGSLSASTSGSSSTSAGGTTYSRELGLSLRTIRISPTIHAAIPIAGTTSDTQTITAHADSEATGLGPFETISETQDVDCSLTPATIPATTGATTWPASGKFLYKVDAQPYRYGYVQLHCVVVDAADFPYN